MKYNLAYMLTLSSRVFSARTVCSAEDDFSFVVRALSNRRRNEARLSGVIETLKKRIKYQPEAVHIINFVQNGHDEE